MAIKTQQIDPFEPSTSSLLNDVCPEKKASGPLDSTVQNRAEQIYQRTKVQHHNTPENPTRFGCSVFALMAGLNQMYSGDLISGGIATVVGAKELYDQAYSRNSSRLQCLLNNVHVDVGMIKMLEEGQQPSYQAIEENLASIPGVDTFYSQFKKIKELNTQCLEFVEESKLRAHERSNASFSEAMQALSEAYQLKGEAIKIISQVDLNAEEVLENGLTKEECTKKCFEKIGLIQKELKEVKECSDDVMNLLREMSSDIKKAEAEALKLKPSDLLIGLGTVVFFSPTETVSAAALGVTTAYAWHHGTIIANTTKKVYNFFFGAPLLPRLPMEKEQYVRVTMDERSSGYYGNWVKGRPSYTCGSVDIKIGDEIAQFRFDLNQSEYPLAKEDLFVLYSKMFTKLKDETLSPIECKKVLHQLEHITIDRGGFHPVARGLIRPMQAAYGLVKALRSCPQN